MGNIGTTGWQEALTAWRTEMRAAGQSPSTIRLRQHYVRRFAAHHADPWSVERDDIIVWLASFVWMPETRRSACTSVRAFYLWAWQTDRIERDPSSRLPKVVVPPPDPRPAPDEVIVSALDGADQRVLIMLLLAAFCGLRRAEIARVHTSHLVGDELYVRGKHGRRRHVPVPPGLAAMIRAQPGGYLFPSRGHQHLTADHVGKLIRRRLVGPWTPHTLRHAAATAWHDAGLDMLEIRPLLGHSSVRTTQLYVAVRSSRQVAAVNAAAGRLAG